MASGPPVLVDNPSLASSENMPLAYAVSAYPDGISPVPDTSTGDRKPSAESRTSSRQVQRTSSRIGDENDHPGRVRQTSLNVPQVSTRVSSVGKRPEHLSRNSSWSTIIRASSDDPSARAIDLEPGCVQKTDDDSVFGVYDEDRENASPSPVAERSRFQVDPEMRLAGGCANAMLPEISEIQAEEESVHASEPENLQRPLHRWTSFLRRTRTGGKPDHEDTAPGTESKTRTGYPQHSVRMMSARRQRQSPRSSLDILSVINSASSGVPVRGSATTKHGGNPRSQRRSWARSNETSNSGVRTSEDGASVLGGSIYDEAVLKRAAERRSILEELISSEESYIADMKILVNVYFALLSSVPALSSQTRTSIDQNVVEILALHEELLGELHRVVPASELNREHSTWRWPRLDRRRHQRGSTGSSSDADVHPRGKARSRPPDDRARMDRLYQGGVTAEPKVAGDVAKVFTSLMRRFLAYEEYGAKYEMMVRDVASTYKSIPTWHAYERGIETLANSLSVVNKDGSPRRKGLTFEDLVIKPIQRVCKYPLLFAALLKVTPVHDCQESHAELEKVLYRLREVTAEINKATHDPRTRDLIGKTWMLQDKLVFLNEMQSHHMAALQLFGRVILCGVLHVAWQGKERVLGEYMVCILFRSYLLLAVMGENGHTFAVVASISLENMKLETADNGRGLQCHNAVFTWKIVFELDCRLYEVLVSACSAREEEVWMNGLMDRLQAESSESNARQTKILNLYSSLSMDIKDSGSVFGQPGTLARRLSVRRATTSATAGWMAQVIIKNTYALRDAMDASTLQTVNRTQSLLSAGRIPTLAPRRAERIRLEHALSDIWTRDMIPYPGMGGKRGEYLIKASASSMMRKLSIASIASTFSKRSTSHAGAGQTDTDAATSPVESTAPEQQSPTTHQRTHARPNRERSSKALRSVTYNTTPTAAPTAAAESETLDPPSAGLDNTQPTQGPKSWPPAASSDKDASKSPNFTAASRTPRSRRRHLGRTLSVEGIRKIFK